MKTNYPLGEFGNPAYESDPEPETNAEEVLNNQITQLKETCAYQKLMLQKLAGIISNHTSFGTLTDSEIAEMKTIVEPWSNE